MIRALIVAFAGGAALLQIQAQLPGWQWLWLLPLALWLATWLPWRALRLVAWLLIALAAGFYYAAGRAEWRLADDLDPAWEGRVVLLQGRVLGLVEALPGGGRWVMAVEGSDAPGSALPQRVRLTAPDKLGALRLRGGDCITVTARLYRPHASQNFGLMDYEAWLFERGIRAEGVVTRLPESAAGCTGGWRAGLDGLRESWRQRLRTQLEDQPYAGVLIALALGDQQAIDAGQWRLFRDTGVTHLMSISGLHITLLSGLIYALALRLWRRSAGLCLRLPATRAAALIGFLAALVYAVLAGFGIPAQRTVYMVAAVAVCLWLGVAHSPTRVLAAALGLVVAIDPWAALAPGFWLSFSAVAVLFYSGAGRLRSPPWWRAWGLTQWAATVGLLPLLIVWFNGISLVSPFANAVAIPLISLITVPLVLLALLLPGLADVAHFSILIVMGVLEGLAHLSQPVWSLATPPLWATALALLGVVVILLPARVLPRHWGMALLLPLLWPQLQVMPAGAFDLRLLDVGQGLSAIVRTAQHTLVYDTGPRYRNGEDAGLRVVAPSLAALGVRRLDALVVSHSDSDHDGGTASLLASHSPQWGLYGQPLEGQRRCVAGQSWEWDGVLFEVLSPPARWAENPHIPDNDRSCVLKVGNRLLLTGDAAHLAELEMVERGTGLEDIAVLVVPHHGSRSSSSAAFLDKLQPRHALIPVGWRNPFGHPHPEVLARYRAIGTRLWRTDRDGALVLHFVGDGVEVDSARSVRRRYWQ